MPAWRQTGGRGERTGDMQALLYVRLLFACSQGLNAERDERRAHARHAWGVSLNCFGRSNPTSKRSIGRRFSGHHRISLRAVAVVAPGIAGVYWAAETHALNFSTWLAVPYIPAPKGEVLQHHRMN